MSKLVQRIEKDRKMVADGERATAACDDACNFS